MKWRNFSGDSRLWVLDSEERYHAFLTFFSPSGNYAYIRVDQPNNGKWEELRTKNLRHAKKTVETIVRMKG